MRIPAHDAASAIGAQVVGLGADAVLDGSTFDSRSVRAGQLFVPIVAARDGHDFAAAALAGGAVATLWARREPPPGPALVLPPETDTVVALSSLARWARARWGTADRRRTVVGITGSVGKTSTKDLAWAALATAAPTWANDRSFNNDQGLPTTVLEAPDDTRVMVLEMGMRGFGEIERLCGIAAPQVGVVTRVAEAHSDRVGGIDGVRRAKSELVRALPTHGAAILNGDDGRVRTMRDLTSAATLLFGESDGCDVRIRDVQLDDLARASFVLDTPWGSCEVRLGVSGRHMASNAAAALACVGVVGGDLSSAAVALAEVRLTGMRMEIDRASSGALVLNDSYNANPTSMRAAIDALADLPARRRVAVLGVMAEIIDAEAEHQRIVDYARWKGVEVIAVGTPMYGVTVSSDPVADVGPIGDGDAVLVKGSRVAALETVARELLAR
jgi:UDP-N-acetylmuramoyl-tripeptide--D-alanyl-D-alanine ligase